MQGEFELIQKIARTFSRGLPREIKGVGDDCAVIPQTSSRSLLVTTDALVEKIHFLRNKISPQDLGYKALAVNLSDIAAMGGIPEYVFLSLALPKNTSNKWITKFLKGFEDLCRKEKVFLVGGDTTRSAKDIFITVTIIGYANSKRIKLRSAAKPGDIVCVTDFLGDSGAGLKLLLQPARTKSQSEKALIRAHLRPQAKLKEGLWLARHSEVHAMMDVSDGIASDLKRIAEQSQCSITIDLEGLPISKPLSRVAQDRQWDAIQIAATSGEDYCLLLTVEEKSFGKLAKQFAQKFGRPLYKIGTVSKAEKGKPKVSFLKNKSWYLKTLKGFDHFEG